MNEEECLDEETVKVLDLIGDLFDGCREFD